MTIQAPADHSPVNRAERMRRRAFRSRNTHSFSILQKVASEAHTIRDTGAPIEHV
jgi:hypothetical protein